MDAVVVDIAVKVSLVSLPVVLNCLERIKVYIVW
jgi:hypothetical protein